MKQQAFFYNGRYFLLPEDCRTTDDVILNHTDYRSFPVKELTQKHCLAPYFLSESVKETKLRLKREALIYPCEVELLSLNEYNARLRQAVAARCPGCPRFGTLTEDDASLEGHHEEITLDGCCFIRQVFEPHGTIIPLNAWMDSCVRAFGKLGLEALLDEGKLSEAREKCYQCLDLCFTIRPYLYFDFAADGRRRMILSNGFAFADALLTEKLLERLEESYGKTWTFVNYIPEGASLPEAVRPKGLLWETNGENTSLQSLTVFCEPEQETGAFLWLNAFYGENRLCAVCGAYHTDTGELPPDAEEPEAFREPLEAISLLQMLPGNEMHVPPLRTVALAPRSMEETEDPEKFFRENGLLTATRLPEISIRFCDPLLMGQRPGNIWGEPLAAGLEDMTIGHLAVGIREFTTFPSMDDPALDLPLRTLGLVKELLNKQQLLMDFQQTYAPGRVDFFFFVPDVPGLLERLRYCSPLFAALPATITLYTASHREGGRYLINFEMPLLETEEQLWAPSVKA